MSKHHRHRRRRRSHGSHTGTSQSQPSRQPVASGQRPPQDTPPAVPRVRTAAPTAQQMHGNPRLGKDLRNIGIVTALMVILLIVLATVL